MGTVRYTVVDGEIIGEKRDGVRRTYLPDPLGSTVALLDNTQAQTDTFSYWPYGEVSARTGTTATPFQHVGTLGYYRDSPTKSYVRARGATLSCLKSIGHDLNLAREWAQAAGLGDLVKLSAADVAAISLLNNYYKAKEFEYRVTGSKRYPRTEDLIALLERILSATKRTCAKGNTKPDA